MASSRTASAAVLPNAGQAAVRDRVAALLAEAEQPTVIGLVGPLGAGKTTVLTALAGGEPVVEPGRGDLPATIRRLLDTARPVLFVDGVDLPGCREVLRDELDRAGSTAHVVMAGRRPVSGAVSVVDIPPWTDAEIRELAVSLGVTAGLDLVERLSGGLPLVARCLSLALLAPTPPDVPGAVADRALRGILARLDPERPDRDLVEALAVVGRGDEELLAELVETPHGPDWFAALTDLSLVTTTECGPTVVEPFRTLLDLKHRWRRPVAHRTAVTKAAARNRRLLTATTDERRRRALTEHSLYLTDDPVIQRMLFPPVPPAPAVRRARPSDHDDIGALVHHWARSGGHDPAKCDRLLEGWLRHTADGFRVVCGPDDRPLGMTYTPVITDRAVGVIEPVTQQHTRSLVDGRTGGTFIGMAVCDDPGAHAALLRHILADGIGQGRMVVATPSPEYQQLVRRLGFGYLGDARHDPYDCGRQSEIHHLGFPTPDSVASWLDRIAATGLTGSAQPDLRWCVAEVRRALEHLHDSGRLARSPLLTSAATPTAEELHAVLTAAITELAAAQDTPTAQAGQIMHAYYVRRRSDHLGVANRLHLSRATYFRRLDHGLNLLAQRLLALFRES
ncbi:energy-coupling factor transporter ATP-binding protein EcfA2 [Saccharothrix tamanrassetensis]|uniref:Energy-coupling factor transporter ATP-binding protein EcfA2 n=1 Tax=Saccharothrix tamanrassetensis TaxID=1051531 RepID=A0A841CMF6_9PSEU|nr:hypothetical protein [Saccharothrix tamanrassetensis]MBB5958113.1 energy-coupling factor transporter ATP-binding protein EcfA2 [Saccharothrix tamanrassetensis]